MYSKTNQKEKKKIFFFNVGDDKTVQNMKYDLCLFCTWSGLFMYIFRNAVHKFKSLARMYSRGSLAEGGKMCLCEIRRGKI